MKFYIAQDGGDTKTKCVLADENMHVLFETQGGPSNFLMLGNQVVSETVLDLINQSVKNTNVTSKDIAGVVLGTTGAGRRTDAEVLENYFSDLLNRKKMKFNFRIESDARIALEGAFTGKPGSILIAGTGSIMFGKDRKGNIYRVGGFGRFIGDEGSGYTIGRLGLQAVAKSFDGRGSKTLLSNLIEEKFNIGDPSALITEIYKNKFDIASVTPLVIQAANANDEICLTIIENQIEELVLHLKSMYKLLNETEMKVSLIGSTITTDNFYTNKFKEKVSVELKNIKLTEPELPPALGAVLMAMNL